MAEREYLIAKSARALVGVEKGFLSPVKGIKGGFVTRRLPGLTSSGKRQLAAKKVAARERMLEAKAGSSIGPRKMFDADAYRKEQNAAAMAQRKASDARAVREAASRPKPSSDEMAHGVSSFGTRYYGSR